MRIKDLPKELRPREKALRHGIRSLDIKELLALIISTGTKDCSALEIAERLVAANREGGALLSVTEGELLKEKGLSAPKALRILASLELGTRLLREKGNEARFSPKLAAGSYRLAARTFEKEALLVFCLDGHSRVKRVEKLVIGNHGAVPFSPASIIGTVISHGFTRYAIAHGHPSGSFFPSAYDIAETGRLKELGERLEVQLVDHVIVTERGHFSFRAAGFMNGRNFEETRPLIPVGKTV